MTTRSRAETPSGHGELVARPPVEEWAALARANGRAADAWEFDIGGEPVVSVRARARRELLGRAVEATARMGLDAAPAPADPGLVIVTGHQPELCHSGVWVKYFLLQRTARESGGVGVDVVVDTDSFDRLGVEAPCVLPGVTRCTQYLAIGRKGSCYACTPVPSESDIDDFCRGVSTALESLPAPAIGRHFSAFCNALKDAVPHSASVSDLVTGARRRYEGDLTDYLELPVTEASRSEAFKRFALHVILDARRFADVHNAELGSYRSIGRIRSAAQPFPDLEITGDTCELPFWLLAEGERQPVFARDAAGGIELLSADGPVAMLPREVDPALESLKSMRELLVPRAITLTLFFRMLVADLFIHGIGGDRYDRITEGVAEQLWGVRLPPHAVASLTMYLPVGVPMVSDEEISAVEQRLNRLTHNPDQVLGEVEFESPEERRAAAALAEEKRDLVAEIAKPDADRKSLGLKIREVNEQLAEAVAPLGVELRERRERLLSQKADARTLTDRTYPFCLWSPGEIADKVL